MANQSPKKQQHPFKQQSGFSRKQTLRASWWLVGSKPDQREQLIAAAHERESQRRIESSAVYAEADGAPAK